MQKTDQNDRVTGRRRAVQLGDGTRPLHVQLGCKKERMARVQQLHDAVVILFHANLITNDMAQGCFKKLKEKIIAAYLGHVKEI